MHKKWLLLCAIVLSLALTATALLWFPFGDDIVLGLQLPSLPAFQIPSQAPTEPTQLPTEPPTDPPTEPPTDPPTDPPTEPPTDPPTEPPTDPSIPSFATKADYSFLYHSGTEEFLHSQGSLDARVYPASLTKMFTALMVVQHMAMDTEITVGAELERVASDASRLGLRQGDVLTVEALLYGMLLPSGNDAAYTLAVATGREIAGNGKLSVSQALDVFMDAMNRAAADAGLSGTHFATPDGYHHANHYSTPRDILTMAQLLLRDPVLLDICGTAHMEVITKAGRKLLCENTNPLLHRDSAYYCPDAVGLKTGYTTPAGYCLVAAFRTQQGYVIAVILKASSLDQRGADMLRLWKNFKSYT